MQNKAEYKGVVEFEIQSIVLWFPLHNAFFNFGNLFLSVLLKTWYSNKIDNEKESVHQFL